MMAPTPFVARQHAQQLEEAKAFLLATFEGEPLPAADVRAQAQAQGISLPTLQRARDALGIRAKKVGSSWQWIPTPRAIVTADTAQKGAQ
jgi:hypothetical protein